CVGRNLASFFLPALDQSSVAHDLDLPPIVRKAHAPAETLLIQASQLWLVRVVIRGPQKRSAQPTPRYIGEIPLYRIALYNVDLVKVALRKSKCISIQKFPIHGYSAVFAKLIKRRFRLCGETNFITPRFFQE